MHFQLEFKRTDQKFWLILLKLNNGSRYGSNYDIHKVLLNINYNKRNILFINKVRVPLKVLQLILILYSRSEFSI